jgi:hypothetical protein
MRMHRIAIALAIRRHVAGRILAARLWRQDRMRDREGRKRLFFGLVRLIA